jgi:membrane-associated HD superfamily phosphohydrolase
MHHGTTRIEYFYQRALALREKNDVDVLDSDFRYPGPKPNTAETAILMLADGVEAAARALDKPTHKRLEGLIGAIVDARMDDGQLDESTLTFADLRRIKDSFLAILMGVYHVRVKYPGDADSEREISGSATDSGANSGDDAHKQSGSSSGDMLTEALN